jgi:SAM-dependent methyltransferase
MILTSSLALKAIARMDREGGDRPYEIVCSDISQVMLKIARRNAREKIQRANNIRAMSRGRLTICETDAGLDVLNGTRKILEVRFVIAGVHELDRLAGDDGVDTFLTAYIQHWITSLEPGVCALEAKIAMNRKIYELLKPGGTEISVEEYPLIVRTDRLDEGMEELPELIQANTSIISIDTLRRIWADIGFTGVCTQQRQIDDLVEHIERCDVQKKAA